MTEVNTALHTKRDWASQLDTMLESQLGLYGQLDALSQSQSELIEAGEGERLLEVLAQRQSVVEEIVSQSRHLEPYRKRWDRQKGELPAARREAIKVRVDALATLAGQIADRDEDDRRKLEAQRSTVKQELDTVGRRRATLGAYAGTGRTVSPRFQDREA